MKKFIKGLLPEKIFTALRSFYFSIKLVKTKKAFSNSGTNPAYLPSHLLEKLQNRYYFKNIPVSYEPEALLERGIVRNEEIKLLLKENFSQIKSCLEIGCGDGMVSACLSGNGIDCTAMDHDDKLFDERAIQKNVKFVVADATALPFETNSFDLVFSYNSFEHISDPEKSFGEALRVLKKGGYLFITFNPQFCSAYGLHAYRSLQVPYLQFLFTENDIKEFVQKENLPPINFSKSFLNGWSLTRYRHLFAKYKDLYNQEQYVEIPDYSGIDLLSQFSSCFKSKDHNFDDFIFSGIRLLFQKK